MPIVVMIIQENSPKYTASHTQDIFTYTIRAWRGRIRWGRDTDRDGWTAVVEGKGYGHGDFMVQSNGRGYRDGNESVRKELLRCKFVPSP